MQPETACHGPYPESIDRLASTLYDLAGNHEVRVIEALAAVLTRQGERTPPAGLSEPAQTRLFTHLAWDQDQDARLAICRRVARRALRGSLIDPTGGATAVHRIDDVPRWAQDLLPIGMFGPFMFYRLTPDEGGARRDMERQAWNWQATHDEIPDPSWWSGSARGGLDWVAPERPGPH